MGDATINPYKADAVLAALGLVSEERRVQQWVTFVCPTTPMPLGDWKEIIHLSPGKRYGALFWVESPLALFTGKSNLLGKVEREAFLERLQEMAGETLKSQIELPYEQMGYTFRYGDALYRVQYFQLNYAGTKNLRQPYRVTAPNGGILLIAPDNANP